MPDITQIDPNFRTQVIPYDNPESGSLPKPDIRLYIQMRLILDLSQMK